MVYPPFYLYLHFWGTLSRFLDRYRICGPQRLGTALYVRLLLDRMFMWLFRLNHRQ